MKVQEMKIIHEHAAGIDVGSRSHFVAIGQKQEEVKEFGVYTPDHLDMIQYLKDHRITTIAMESTGSYWQTLFAALQDAGFEVILVSGHQTKNVLAKTDVKDSKWIQKLHSMGLLQGSYLPSSEIARLRTIHRHRQSLIEQSSKMSNKMQKALRLLNVRLDVVLSDITGKSGLRIIEAILGGERDSIILSSLADKRVRKSQKEISDALQGQWEKEELLYELEDCYEIFKFLQNRINQADKKMEALLMEFNVKSAYKKPEIELTKKQTKGKNQPRFNISLLSYQYYGVDLMAIESISSSTILALLSEIGDGIYRFRSAKAFASWLRLAPNNRISGGKTISSRTPKGSNKFALALRNAANTISNKKNGALVSFFKRIAYKKGRAAAITATARKLACIIYSMIIRQEEYRPMGSEQYQELIKLKRINSIRKMMKNSNILASELSMS